MDAAERALLEETVRDVVTAATTADPTAPVDDALAGLGWLEMLEAEPRDAVEIVFTALGAANATTGMLDDVLAVALGHAPRPDLAVVLPTFGSVAPPGAGGAGLGTVRLTRATEVLVVTEDGTATVPVAACTVSPVGGVDPTGGWQRVTVPAEVGPAATSGAWVDAVAAGQRALGHQIAGATRTMLDLARAHALERVQFGKPIASFQAVRHRLAETLVAIEGLEATLHAAWDAGTPFAATLAKAAAGRAVRRVAGHCQQVLAGIGFTTDHVFHRYLKRTMVLEGVLGAADDLVVTIGRELVRTRTVPTVVDL